MTSATTRWAEYPRPRGLVVGSLTLAIACNPVVDARTVAPEAADVTSKAADTSNRGGSGRDEAAEDAALIRDHHDRVFLARACPRICQEEGIEGPCNCELTHKLHHDSWLVFQVTRSSEGMSTTSWYAAGRPDERYRMLPSGGDNENDFAGITSMCTVMEYEDDPPGARRGGLAVTVDDYAMYSDDLGLDCDEGYGGDRFLIVCPSESDTCSENLWTHRYDGDTLVYQADIEFQMGWFIPRVRIGDPSKAEGQQADSLPGVTTNPPEEIWLDEEDLEDDEGE